MLSNSSVTLGKTLQMAFRMANENFVCGIVYLQDGLIHQCGETMKETINVKTVCSYYNSAGTYGLDSVKKK